MENINKIISQLSLQEKADLCSGQNFWHLKGIERFDVPGIMVTDGPHGLRKQMGDSDHLGLMESVISVCFPTAAALASSFDRELLREIGSTLGKECQAENIGVLLGPGANIKRSPLCGRNFEYFSEDPYLSGEMATAHIVGLQGEGVGCSIKHFAANNQENDRMKSNSVIDERTFNEIYLASFEKPVKCGKPKTVMCSYNKINGTFASENRELLTNILREKWGFDGFVVTDWGAGKGLVSGVKAGLDLRMPGGYEKCDDIVKAINSGELSEAVLDETVRRILTIVEFVIKNRAPHTIYDREKDHEIACKTATECAVLLKNKNDILPLDKTSKIAFIGDFAQTPRFQGGGSSHINSYRVDSALECVNGMNNIIFEKGFDVADESANLQLIESAVKAAKSCETAVIFAGLPERYESEGFDRTHINLPNSQTALIDAVCDAQPNTIIVLHNGCAIAMPWVDKAAAVLEMYLGGEAVGSASVKLLFGDAVPSGKLAESFPLKLEDNCSFLNFPGFDATTVYHEGIYVGYRYYDAKKTEVLFPFGHGLSYSSFKYSNLKLDKTSMKDTDTLTVNVDVTNTGTYKAKEVVQLYVRGVSTLVPQAIRQLKGFEKLELAPNETKTASFKLSKRDFAYYEVRIHDWFCETADYAIEIGASSRDIRLHDSIHLESTFELPFIANSTSSIGEVLANSKGRSVLGPILAKMSQSDIPTDGSAMGDGFNEMKKAMMMQMPLASIASFGMISPEVVEQIVNAINS